MHITRYDRILWDLVASSALEKNIQFFTALPASAGAFGSDYAVELAPPVLAYDLTASGVEPVAAGFLEQCAAELYSILELVTNTGRTVQGRVLSFSKQEVPGTGLYNLTIRLRSVSSETEIDNNFNINSFTNTP